MYDFLVGLQSFENNFLTVFFKLISDVITSVPLSLFAIIIYLCINKKKGIKLALSIISTVVLNSWVKLIFKIKRPFLVREDIKRLDDTTGYSFPSGHTQQASSIAWILKGEMKNKKIGVFLWFIVILMVGTSRMYLGMHTPLDVVFGAVLGFVTAVLIEKFFNVCENRPVYLHIITLVSLIAMVLTKFDSDILKMTALSLGAVSGYIIDVKYIGYKVPKGIGKKICAGIIGVLLVMVEKGIFLALGSEGLWVDFLDYALLGFVITAIAPYFINKIVRI